MKNFMDENFLLENETAIHLFHNCAKNMPIVDYHCHINPEDIANDKTYDSITDIWLGGDHYKWRLMRANGISESEITGNIKSNPYKVFENFAITLPKAIGNPLYHWTHLELQRYFDIEKTLNQENSKEIYSRCNEYIKSPNFTAKNIIKNSNVKLICTTDNPEDDLHFHKQIKDDTSFNVKVLPAFRPSKAVNIADKEYKNYIEKLEKVCGYSITSYKELLKALYDRIKFFNDMGCKTADHTLEEIIFVESTDKDLEIIFKKALNSEPLSTLEINQFSTKVLLDLTKEYYKYNWVLQIHFGCIRNLNTSMFKSLGADTGFDAIKSYTNADNLAKFFDKMKQNNTLPKMVLYSLNQYDNEIITTVSGCFAENSLCPGQIQIGAAWWFNDTKSGMEKQLLDLSNSNLLGNFIGMLTDSRSLLSYTRHEYFRRILCNYIGKLVENGEYPNDIIYLENIIKDICYNNVIKFFNFDL